MTNFLIVLFAMGIVELAYHALSEEIYEYYEERQNR